MTNLVTEVANSVEQHGDNLAIKYKDQEISYVDLWDRIEQFSSALEESDFGVDDRVAIYMPNRPEFVIAFYGTLKAGGVVVPMNPQYKSREIEYRLSDSEARAVVTTGELASNVKEAQLATEVDEIISIDGGTPDTTPFETFKSESHSRITTRKDDDVAVLPYTSGTTGVPKGVKLTHENLMSNVRQIQNVIPGGVSPNDKQFGILPLFHIYGLTWLMNLSLFNGATYYPVEDWDPQGAASIIEREQLTLFHAVPAMYNDVINHPNTEEFDLSSLRMGSVGGSTLPLEVMQTFEERYGIPIYEAYGLTETSPTTHANTESEKRVGSIGKPVKGVESMIVDDQFEEIPPVENGPIDESEYNLDKITGEIVVTGPNVMNGYYNLPEKNEEAFTFADEKRWFHTGDIGYHDEDGFYFVVDREKHVIITGGYNVYPREVEELLYEHEAVTEAAVVGVSDDRRGETVKAYIVPNPTLNVTSDEIQKYCLENLAEYKHPRIVEFVESLPRTASGKVQKYELEER
jgi:long-chain acyl-CoA synthetase